MPRKKTVLTVECSLDGCSKTVERRPYELRASNYLAFCGRAHGAAYNRKKIRKRTGRPAGETETRPCSLIGCDGTVTRRPSEFKAEQAFCDIVCANKYKNVPGRAFKNKPGPKPKTETRSCFVCSDPVTRRPCEMPPIGNPVFCGYEHSNQYTNKRSSEAAEVHKICANPACPKPDRKFTVMRCEGFRKYCSESCMGKDPSPEAVAARIASGVKAFMAARKTQNKQKDTPIELALQDELTRRGISFRTQVPLLDMTVVDIFIKPNIVIYADGMLWHNLPSAKIRDARNNKALRLAGYKVFRFTGKEIHADANSCIDKVLSTLPGSTL